MSTAPTIADVQRRRTEIKVERTEISCRDSELQAEDADLMVAERALLRLAGLPPTETSAHSSDAFGSWLTPAGWNPPPDPAPAHGTLEELITYLLRGAVDPWALATQIQAGLTHYKQQPVPMSSISPTLTTMKNKGAIVRDGLKVALTSRVPQAQVGSAHPVQVGTK
jgi:hypothetical protein